MMLLSSEFKYNELRFSDPAKFMCLICAKEVKDLLIARWVTVGEDQYRQGFLLTKEEETVNKYVSTYAIHQKCLEMYPEIKRCYYK
jgi:hypothetical protein